jgi:PAS domain S-box-containing protein
MPKFSLSSLRSRALGLILLAILPLLALTLYSYFGQRSREIRRAQTDEIVAARYIAATQEAFLRNTRNVLITLARLPEMQRRDCEACNILLDVLFKQSPDLASIVAVNSDGLRFASAPVAPGPINYADRSWFQKVIQTRDFVAGGTVLGRTSGKYGHILAYPILDREGRFQGALAVQFDLEWIGNLLKKSNFPSNTAIVLTDSSRKVLFRYPDPQKYLGQMLPEAFIKPMTEREEGVAAGVGLPGDPRLFAFVRLSPPWQEMWVAIGLPREWVVSPVNRSLWHNLIWLGLVALFAMAAAWYGGDRFIVRPVKKLQGVTGRLAAGDLTVRSGPDYTAGELGLLAQSFDQMADSLQGRLEETKGLLNDIKMEKDKLSALINSINDEVWFADTQKKFILANPSALREFGLGATEEIDVEKFAESLEVCRPDGSPRPVEEAPALRALQGELVRNLEEIIRTPGSGEFRYRLVSAAPVRDGSGNIMGSVSVVRDINELKQAEQALRRAHDELEQRVKERTAELHLMVEQLQKEVGERLEAEKALHESKEQLRYLSSQLLIAQEKERQLIGLELHDDLGQLLVLLKIQLRVVQGNLSAESAEIRADLEDARDSVNEIVERIRRLSKSLRPSVLEDMGLSTGLKLLFADFQKHHGLELSIDMDDVEKIFSWEHQILIYRIFQESLANVAKHSRATRMVISIKQQDDQVAFQMQDNGTGFNLQEVLAQGSGDRGLGLAALEERVRILRGDLQLWSQPGQGTRIQFRVPMDNP